eukprot:scaffold308317_cov30-Prasinocladus_malaysianus.AAC.1
MMRNRVPYYFLRRPLSPPSRPGWILGCWSEQHSLPASTSEQSANTGEQGMQRSEKVSYADDQSHQ